MAIINTTVDDNMNFKVTNHTPMAFKFDNCKHWLTFEECSSAFYCRKEALKLGRYYGADTIEFKYVNDIYNEPIIDVVSNRGSCKADLYAFKTEQIGKFNVKEITYYTPEELFTNIKIKVNWY